MSRLIGIFIAFFIGVSSMGFSDIKSKPISMPLYDAKMGDYKGFTPQPLRDESVRKYLSCSFRIRVSGAIGSGTLCYYDSSKNIAYIISCSHLFSVGDTSCKVEVFYKNNEKLASPAQYPATVICFRENYQTHQAEDISFIKFTPDWVPDNYYPIAPTTFQLPKEPIVSSGCDGAGEVAAYMVRVVGKDRNFLITEDNSPRPGRSGGGLLTLDGRYVGICVRTSDVSGNGRGFFVMLEEIHKYASANNLAFLLNVNRASDFLRKIPIIDRNGPQQSYPPDYLPVPY